MINDSEEIIVPTKRFLLTNSEEINNSVKIIRVEEDLEPFKRLVELTPSSSNHNVQLPSSKNTTVDNTYKNVDSCLITVPSSQYISNTNDLPPWFDDTVANNNVNNDNSLHSKTANKQGHIKRKVSNDCPVFNNKNEDPFDYMDIDEIENHPKKKSKNRETESIFFPMVDVSSSKQNEQSKTVETNSNTTVDPNSIMNLLSEAKGTGQFIDASILSNKSVIKYIKLVVT